MKDNKKYGVLDAALCMLLWLTACAVPQSQQESTRPEAIQTQTVSPQVTENPVTQEEEAVPTVGVDGQEIPNEDVEFGE